MRDVEYLYADEPEAADECVRGAFEEGGPSIRDRLLSEQGDALAQPHVSLPFHATC